MEAFNQTRSESDCYSEDQFRVQPRKDCPTEPLTIGAVENSVADQMSDSLYSRPKAERGAFSDAARYLPDRKDLKRFSFFSSKRGSAVHAAEFGDLVPLGESVQDLFDTGPARDTWWLNILSPTKEEVDTLAKLFSIHPLTSEDINTRETHEKVDAFKNYYFVCFRSFTRTFKAGKYHVEPSNVYILVFREGILSITFNMYSHAANVQNRIDTLRNYMALRSDWICYALIDDIVDSFSPLINEIEDETNAIEDSVFITRTHELSSVLSTVHACRKETMGAIHLLRGKGVVIKNLARHCDEISLFLDDIQDHLLTMISKLNHYEEILSRSHSDYLARLSMDRYHSGSQSMKFILKITVIAAVILPLMTICGLFGMNIRVPGKGTAGLSWWLGILGTIIFIVLAFLAIAKRTKLI